MKSKIILIDDDQHLPAKVRGLLKSWNLDYHYDVLSNPDLSPADYSESAKSNFCNRIITFVEEQNDGNIEVILLDVFFGGENGDQGDNLGYEIGRNLRLRFPEIPIVLFTVHKNYQEALNAFNFDGYILKGDFNNWTNSDAFLATAHSAGLRRKRVLEECHQIQPATAGKSIENPVIMHISDIHRGIQFVEDDPELYKSTLKSLIRDTEKYPARNIPAPNLIVVSGDITNKGSIAGYAVAKKFLLELGQSLNIPSERIVLCQGNHDIDRAISRLSYGLDPYSAESDKNIPANPPDEHYLLRFAAFKNFFDDFYDGNRVYHLENNKMFSIFDYSSTFGIVAVCFNSCERLDNLKDNLDKAYISLETIEQVKLEIKKLELDSFAKIAVWHHPFLFEHIGNQKFHHQILEQLSKIGFIIHLHGHIHEPDNRNPPKSSGTGIAQFGAGTIGVTDKPNDIPRHYEILAFDHENGSYTVYSRQRLGIEWVSCPSFLGEKDKFSEQIPNNLLQNI